MSKVSSYRVTTSMQMLRWAALLGGLRRQLKRRYVLTFFHKLPRCLVHWSRELQALGHTVRLMPPADVKPFTTDTHTRR